MLKSAKKSRWRSVLSLAIVASCWVSPRIGTTQAQPLDWLERYALAPERGKVLSELIPGTEDYYFYHCLHFQVTGQLDKAESLLTQWKNDERARHSGYLQGIEDRQRLLTYSSSPERSIQHLRDRLNINLDHAGPIKQGQQLYPARIDDALLDANRLLNSDNLNDATGSGIRQFAARIQGGEINLDPDRFAALLQRIDGPWVDGLANLVLLEWKQNPTNRSWGDRSAHQYLTADELEQVAAALPDVRFSDAMVHQRIARLRPSDDTDMRQQPEVYGEYLARLDAYVQTLPVAYLSLKAGTLYQRLQFDLTRDVYDKNRFLRYLRIPRNSGVIDPRLTRDVSVVAELERDHYSIAHISPIYNDEKLIRTYLEHFLAGAEDTKEFTGLLVPSYLRTVFAEAKLLSGATPTDPWFAMLDANSQASLRDRVELTLAPNNPATHSIDAKSELLVDIKNIEKLTVCIYRINLQSYYRTRTETVNTDIDLDGLVPTSKRELTFNQPSLQRHHETIELPEIEGRGVWVVDLLGGGLRARAMIRRGELQYAIKPTAGGQQIIAIGEDRRPIKDGKLWIGSRELVADANGVIDIPLAALRTTRQAILGDAELAIPIQLSAQNEAFTLDAGMLLDQQQVQSGREATLVLRPRVSLNGVPVDPSALLSPVMRIVATDLDGIASTREFKNLELSQSGELTIVFRVPPRVANITATLSGDLSSRLNQSTQSVSAQQSWSIASIRTSTHTSAIHLTRDSEHYVAEIRGRSGETIAGRVVNCELQPEIRQNKLFVTLQSDAQGRIDLGPLKGISSVRFLYDGLTSDFDLQRPNAHWPATRHASAGETLALPLPRANAEPSNFRLLSLRAQEQPFEDLSNHIVIKDGQLRIQDLEAGNFVLIDKQTLARIKLFFTDGPVVEGVAVGQVRQLEIAPASPLAIAEVAKVDDGLKIRLIGYNKDTRVHLIAHRFVSPVDELLALRLPSLPTTARGLWHAPSGYISDLKLGEEYQYVLRRQLAAKFPGVMLPQPGLILNPWETRSTENRLESAEAGQQPPPAPMSEAEALSKQLADQAKRQQESQSFTNDFDFLNDPGILQTNLVPNADGVLLIPAEAIKAMPEIQIIAADGISIVRRVVTVPLEDTALKDLRLADHLEPKEPYAFQRGIVIASPDSPLDMRTLGSAQVQVYSSVRELFELMITLQSDERLREFAPLGLWNTMQEDAKHQFYGRMACHELHLFLHAYDRPFFDKVVRPYLANKLEKQIVDEYLLDRDLTTWTETWRYQTLNAAEKVLLATRIPAMRETVPREFRELTELSPDDPAMLRRLVESGLAGKVMSSLPNQWLDINDPSGEDKLSDVKRRSAFGLVIPSPAAGGMGGAVANLTDDFDYPSDSPSELSALSVRAEALSREQKKSTDNRPTEAGLRFRSLAEKQKADRWFYQPLDETKQWAESQWDLIRVTATGSAQPLVRDMTMMQGPHLIPVNAFWTAVAQQTEVRPNEHLLRAFETRHAVLASLVFCGLPLQSPEITLPVDDQSFTPPHPVALVTKKLVELKATAENDSLLVGQRFSDANREASVATRGKPNVEIEEFLTHRVYRGEIIISNPSPTERTIDVLWQIPEGSLPLQQGHATDSKTLVIEPFAIQKIEYSFYFPSAGSFTHYPACISSEGQVIARGAERTFNVLAFPSKVDGESWSSIAAEADAEKMNEFLSKANLREINWELVAHRMKDADIYKTITKYLREQKIYRADLWGYSLHHRDLEGIATLISSHQTLLQNLGPTFELPWFKLEPVARQNYEILEFAPMVSARIHRLKDERDILNASMKEQVLRLLRIIAHQREPKPQQKLALVYYRLLENRIEEAITLFQDVDAADIETRLQYDYMRAYLALHQSDYSTAMEIANQYSQHPVPRWRQRFSAISGNLRQREALMKGESLVSQDRKGSDAQGNHASDLIAGDLALQERENSNENAAVDESFVGIQKEGNVLQITYRNATAIEVRLYAVDLELLFSKTPFVREDLSSMAMVDPIEIHRIATKAGGGTIPFRLNEAMANQTLLVEAVADGVRATTLHYGGRLSTVVAKGIGQVQVIDASNGQPVETAYVKVYAKRNDGTIEFYKDGYTDLRGRFDYVSVSAGNLETVQQFAVLVTDAERGASLSEVSPPNR